MKRKLAEEQSDMGNDIPLDQMNYAMDGSIPDQFSNTGNPASIATVFDKINYVQIDELPINETLMGRAYPEQWKNLTTQDTSTMTDFKKPHGRKKQAISNYTLSDRTCERSRKDGSGQGDTTQGNLNGTTSNVLNRRIPDGTIIESYQKSALDRTNVNHREPHSNNNSANSKYSKSGANYDLKPIADRNYQEQFHRKPKKGELRETNTTVPPPKENRNNGGGGQSVPPTVSDRYFEVRIE